MSNDLGIDRSGNGNNWTVNNITYSDQVVDSPTNNFCTINPLDVETADKLKEGNLYANSGPARCRGTMAVSSGKWYYEMLMVYQHHGTAGCGIRGVGGDKISVETGNDYVYINHPNNSGVSINVGGSTTGDLSNGVVSGGSGDSSPGSIIGVMWDMDAETITFKSNNSALASALTDVDFSGISNKETIAPYFLINGGRTAVVNFGQDSSFAGLKTAQGNQDGNSIGDFYYTPPTGFLALCTKNLPDVDVVPSEHFDVALYTGDSSVQSITSLGFQPSFTWIKERSDTAPNQLFDAVRGVTKNLASNVNSAETTNDDTLTHFLSNGFTTGDDNRTNSNGETYVSWNWKANGSGSSNTDGSINTISTSANVDAGFSISTYTSNGTAGATVGHGLSKAPELVIIKNRDAAYEWAVAESHTGSGFTSNNVLFLDLNNAYSSSGNCWNSTAPTSTLVTLGDNGKVNISSAHKFIMYCFHSVDGYSKVGSYVGNGNADGTFVYTGFKPMMVIYKRSSASEDWYIRDTARDTTNPGGNALSPNSTGTTSNNCGSSGNTCIDYLSNGFKLRGTDTQSNDNGSTYIYIAFASVPFKFSNAR